MYSAKIILDSVFCDSFHEKEYRLVTYELTYPRFIHAELMTHRALSKNSASSRAIPISKIIKQVLKDPALPVWWGKNQAGMKARDELTGFRYILAQLAWRLARYPAVLMAWILSKIGLHKQIANRLLEPWMYITVIVSGTEWDNFFKLRNHADAQPELRAIAVLVQYLYMTNTPKEIMSKDWHMPYITGADKAYVSSKYSIATGYYFNLYNYQKALEELKKISVARCARVSYLSHDGKNAYEKDIALFESLIKDGHMSPLEHVATPTFLSVTKSNYRGFRQLRDFYNKTA